jgi:hypothetical protein
MDIVYSVDKSRNKLSSSNSQDSGVWLSPRMQVGVGDSGSWLLAACFWLEAGNKLLAASSQQPEAEYMQCVTLNLRRNTLH